AHLRGPRRAHGPCASHCRSPCGPSHAGRRRGPPRSRHHRPRHGRPSGWRPRRCRAASTGEAHMISFKLRLEARPSASLLLLVTVPVLSSLAALIIALALLAVTEAPLARAVPLLIQGAAGSTFALSETLTRATPLILTGLAAAIAFRARLWNI